METETEIFKKYLNKKNLKFTHERQSILKEIFLTHNHFDIESLYERLKTKGKNISRATIYRTIPLLIESNLINKAIRYKDRIYYEHIYGHKSHSHFICINCGKIIEFENDEKDKIIKKIKRKYNFKIVESKLIIKGYCKNCLKKEKK